MAMALVPDMGHSTHATINRLGARSRTPATHTAGTVRNSTATHPWRSHCEAGPMLAHDAEKAKNIQLTLSIEQNDTIQLSQ